jgi:hypothetical protein
VLNNTTLKGEQQMFKEHGFSDARDLMIILWVIMQGLGWFMPENYGMFQAQTEKAYLEYADILGYWSE